MSKHTPGPWLINKSLDDPDDLAIRDKGDDQCLAVVLQSEGLGLEKEANARLIASSPELLSSLESILGVLNPDKDGGYFICEEAGGVVREARKVIREAVSTGQHRKPEMKIYSVISKYSCWVVDEVEAVSKEEALTKAGNITHSDAQIGLESEFEGLEIDEIEDCDNDS